MGIKQNITLRGGVEVQDAYLKIHKGDIDHQSLRLFLKIYKNKECRDADILDFVPTDDFDNLVKIEFKSDFFKNEIFPALSVLKAKLYEHIKTLPEYQGSIDILE